jgi:hypothetical protein
MVIKKEIKLSKRPKFGGGVLADNARPQSSGKIDVQGVFTLIHAWGYPAPRLWTLILTIFDVPKLQTTLHVGLSKKGSKQIDTLATSDIKDEQASNSNCMQIELGYIFAKEGDYEIVCSLKDYSSKLRIPLRVKLREWPIFSEKEIAVLNNNKSLLPHKVSAQVTCEICNRHFVFEEKIIPSEEYTEGTLPFPITGIYECEYCGNKLKLKDVQGQIRASVKDNLLQFINHKAHV